MSKAERLIEMMITINAKKDFTVGELAKEFSVSKRTILRDLQELEQAGFPLYSEVGAAGGYHILKERILPPITFSENEAKAIFFACQALKFYHQNKRMNKNKQTFVMKTMQQYHYTFHSYPFHKNIVDYE